MGISLWLIPPPEVSQKLEVVIKSIASRYSSPTFQPHVTLYSFPITDPNILLPPQDQLPPTIPITFQRVCTGKTWSQSVLIELEKMEDSVLQALYNQVENIRADLANKEGVPMTKKFFYPHLSLYYGDPPMEVKEEIAASLKADGTVSTSGPLTVGGVEQGFHVSEIWAVNTGGPVEGWEVLKKVKLPAVGAGHS
ncbi:hypothetical protein FRB90_003504 [Tulasnella sp. 427]|nr:hypothetical protein FRB90_003504 [Tulasnella sp. 427]